MDPSPPRRCPRRVSSLFLFLCCLALATPLAAGPPAGGVEGPHGAVPGFPVNSCYVCHDIVAGSTGRDSVQRPNETCLGCHTDGPTYGEGDPLIQDRPHATPVGDHASLVTGTTKFTYGDLGVDWPYPDNERQIHCTTCHAPHRTFDPADPDPSTSNIKYIRDHTDDYQVLGGLVVWSPYKEIKVIDNTGPTPVTVIKQVDQDIVYTGPGDFADGVGQSIAEADVCEVCHTLTDHHQVDGMAPGGQSHFDGENCTTCHSHPNGFAPSGGEPLTGPHAAFGDPDCGACHDSTFFPGAADNPSGLASVFCQTCHGPGSTNYSEIHSHLVTGSGKFDYTIECTACHDQHGWDITNADGNSNLDYVKATINEMITVIDNTHVPPVQVDKTITSAIVFDSQDDFANGDAFYDRDICNTCHTLTNHHQNDGAAPGGQSHFDGEVCTSCHRHPEGFGGFGGAHPQANTDCSNCHLGSDGQPDLTGVHGDDCGTCHTVAIPDTILGPVGTWNQECVACHNSLVEETGHMDEPTKGHRCVVCHGQQRGTSAVEDVHKRHAEEANCIVCHGFIPDVGVAIGSGNRDACQLCHVGGRSGTIRRIHRGHTDEGLSCFECHGAVRPPVDVVTGPPVGGAANVCDLCHNGRDPFGFDDGDHKRHAENKLDCGSCHSDANLQDDRDPMPPTDDPVRASLDRSGSSECSHCHSGGQNASSEEAHEKHVANQWQWCFNCHEPDDQRPMGGVPPVTRPDESCALCHGGYSYSDSEPFSVHDTHSGTNKCYSCHQTIPRLVDWPRSWLGGVDNGAVGVTVRDEFNAVSFDNNDGRDAWAGPWLEDDPESGGAGPTSGQVRVVDGSLRLDDRPDTGGQPSAARTVNLSGSTSATFSFDWSTTRRVDSTDEITVEVSADGGGSYTTLMRITGFVGAQGASESFDISASITSTTTIRFRVSTGYGEKSEYFYADNVEIHGE